jgi:hypothetical protein
MLRENDQDIIFQRVTGRSAALCVAVLLMAAPQLASAQTQNAPTLQAPDPGAKPSEAQKPPSSALPSTGETLSETLSRSGGVIRPPGGVDSQINVPPKDSGAGSAMPVIPPPSPGSSPNVQPR